jgi:hypothetical protein
VTQRAPVLWGEKGAAEKRKLPNLKIFSIWAGFVVIPANFK